MPAAAVGFVLAALILEPLLLFLRCALAAYVGASRRCNVLLAHFAPPFHVMAARRAASSAS